MNQQGAGSQQGAGARRHVSGPVPPYPYASPGPHTTDGGAVWALVLALLSFILPVVPAAIALVLAAGARRRIAAAGGRLDGADLARSAAVLAALELVLAAAFVATLVVLAALESVAR